MERKILIADAILNDDPSNAKAILSKANALAELGEYRLALATLDEAPSLDQIQEFQAAAQEWDRQSTVGRFDLSAYILSGCQDDVKLGNFVGPGTIASVPGKGRGFIATEDVEAGRILLCENPIVFSYGSFDMNQLKASLQEAAKSPKLMTKLMAMEGATVPAMAIFTPNSGVVDLGSAKPIALQRLMRIVVDKITWGHLYCARNGMLRPQAFYGLWPLLAFVNHSCSYNASIALVGQAMFLVASTRIRRGEEIVFSYVDPCQPYFNRHNVLGFQCSCRRCLLELQRPAITKLKAKFTQACQHYESGERSTLAAMANDAKKLARKEGDKLAKAWIRTIFWVCYRVNLGQEKAAISFDDAWELHRECTPGQLGQLSFIVKRQRRACEPINKFDVLRAFSLGFPIVAVEDEAVAAAILNLVLA